MNKPRYIVIETTMFPAKWKVMVLPPYRDTNATCNYFRTKEEAQREADRRNNNNFPIQE